MQKRRFSEEQIIGILHELDSAGEIGDVCRRYGVAEATLHRWWRKYGGLQGDAAWGLKALEEENCSLKRIVADQALNLQVVKALLRRAW